MEHIIVMILYNRKDLTIMSKKRKLISLFISLSLFILILVGTKNEALQPIITKWFIAFATVLLILNICIGINQCIRYIKRKNN